jgi:hypothetical protein
MDFVSALRRQPPWIPCLLPAASRHRSHPSASFEMTLRRSGIPALCRARHGLLLNDVALGESKLFVGCIPELWWRYSCRLLTDNVAPAETRLCVASRWLCATTGHLRACGLQIVEVVEPRPLQNVPGALKDPLTLLLTPVASQIG